MAPGRKKASVDPRQLQQLMQQAIAAHQQGRLEEAERGYTQVLKAIPDQPDALNLSGLVAHQQGKSGRAVILLKKAVKARPQFADAYNHLGMAQRKLGQLNAAVDAFSSAVAADPNHAEAQNNLGNALKDKDDLTKAAMAYRAAIALAPNAVEPRYNLGNVLRDLEQHPDAMAAYDGVLEIQPNHVEARFNLAALYERRHELDAAQTAVQHVLRLQPGLAPALILKAKILRRQKRFDETQSTLGRLEGVQISPDDAINLAFEEGRLFDAIGETDGAFAAFVRGNALQAEAGGKKLMREADNFRTQIKAWTTWLDAGQDGVVEGDAGDGLVFLVGFPRSGTTLLDQVLDAHPDISVMEERPAVTRMLAEAKSRKLHLPDQLSDLTQEDAEALRAAYFAEVDRHMVRSAAKILVDKMPLNIVHVAALSRVFPKARYILALRHPLDVMLSNFMQLYRLNGAMANFLTLERAAETYDLVMQQWLVARAKLGLNVHEVRYESLVSDLERQARDALAFLDVPWDPNVLDTVGHVRARKIINTPSYEQVAEPVQTKSSGRWVRYAGHLTPVEAQLKSWIERLGY